MILVIALGLHFAEVGIIGLLIIVLATAFTGVTEEQRLGKAFEAALPFTALLVVFFAIVAILHDQHLFEPVVSAVLQLQGRSQTAMFYLANAALSAISDNVFVATIYITEVKAALLEGTIDARAVRRAGVAINTGTNIPSVATPNGQAAFLFLLTSALAPLIQTFVRADDVDGAALHRDADADWPLGRCIPAVGAGTRVRPRVTYVSVFAMSLWHPSPSRTTRTAASFHA